MTDRISPEQRSALMARISGKDTRPEWQVRRLLHGLGYRYRLHDKRLPGTPDIVFKKRKKAIFVHGCFWHSHPGCKRATLPKTRSDFWRKKLRGNRERDRKTIAELMEMEWDVLVVWECALKKPESLVKLLVDFLESPNSGGSVRES